MAEVPGATTDDADLIGIDGRSRFAEGRTRWRQPTPYSLTIWQASFPRQQQGIDI
jgi:hypothetical protein